MSNLMQRLLVIMTLILSIPSLAKDTDEYRGFRNIADRCYEETVRAASGVDPNSLSTISCRRAMRLDPLNRYDKSIILHNQGLIEQTKGDLVAAKSSFLRAVRLSSRVDQRNLALAQLAFKLGDLRLAIEQYDLLAGPASGISDRATRNAVLRNRQLVLDAQLTEQLTVSDSR